MPEQRSLVEQIDNTPIIPNSLAVWGLGQMGLVVKGPDAVLVIDPYLSDTGSGARACSRHPCCRNKSPTRIIS